MIHGDGHSSNEGKILGKFETKYDASHPTKDSRRDPISRSMFHKKQEKHTIIDNMVDEVRIIESKKVSAVNHKAPEFL